MSQNSLIPTTDEMNIVQSMAKRAVESKYFQALGGESGLAMIMLYARDLNIPLTQAIFGGMHSIQGKITISANMMNNLIRKAGHRLEIIENSNNQCTIKGTRRDTGDSCTCGFSIADAKLAGVYKAGGSWDKYPSDMCFARAISRLARRLFPDIIGPSYVEGELDKPEKEEAKKEQKSFDQAVEVVEEVKYEEKKIMTSEHVKELEDAIGDDKTFLVKLFAWQAVSSLSELDDKLFDKLIAHARKNARPSKQEYVEAETIEDAVDE